MSWLFPAFLAGGLLVGLPILLHFLRRKTKNTISFPSLRFLGETAVRETKKHRIRRWLVLTLRCLVIGLIACAFARPFWTETLTTQRKAMVIVIDNSYSMQRTDQWERMKQWVQAQMNSLSEADVVGVLLMNPSPAWLVRPAAQKSKAQEEVGVLQPGFEITRFNPALRLAAETLVRIPAAHKSIVWMSDMQRAGCAAINFNDSLPPGIDLILPENIKPPAKQAAITNFRLRQDNQEIFADLSVQLFAPKTADRNIEFYLRDRVVTNVVVSLKSEAIKTLLIPLNITREEASLGVKISLDHDDLEVDDVAYGALQSSKNIKVILPENPHPREPDFLSLVLNSTETMASLSIKKTALPNDSWPLDSVAFLRGNSVFLSPQKNLLEDFLKKGGQAWLWMDGSQEQLSWLKERGIEVSKMSSPEGSHLRNFDLEHPLLSSLAQDRLLPLYEAEFKKGWAIKSDQLSPIATWKDRSIAIGSIPIESGQLLICGFYPEKRASDWPLKSSFLPFIHQIVTQLAQPVQDVKGYKVSDSIPLYTRGTWKAVDSPRTFAKEEVSETITPRMPGLYEFKSNERTQYFAVNLTTEESDLGAWPQQQDWVKLKNSKNIEQNEQNVKSTVSSYGKHDSEQHQQLWRWILYGVLLLMIVELSIANRTAL